MRAAELPPDPAAVKPGQASEQNAVCVKLRSCKVGKHGPQFVFYTKLNIVSHI